MQSAMLLLLFSASLTSANLNCYYDASTYSSYYDSYNRKTVQCYAFTSFCFMQTTTVGNNTYRRLADCDYNYNTMCVFSGCTTQGSTETCCCRTNYCNDPSAIVVPTTAPMVRSSGYPATANLNCYSDVSSYSNYYDSYNRKTVQCYAFTSFCFMQTTTLGNHIARVADCDYNRMCVVSGCYTQGGIETCCCRNNYCNDPSDVALLPTGITLQPHNSAAPQSSGYSTTLPIIFTVLSYAFLK